MSDEIVEDKKPETPDLELNFAGKYRLRCPVEFEGTRHEEISYDLERLKAKDVITCRREVARMKGGLGEALLTDDLLHAVLFARAADLPSSFVLEMGAADYAAWATVAQGFFGDALSGLTS